MYVTIHYILLAVINVTLPDEKQNYVHRIGRVGRAERMGLAISLVSTVPEKVTEITAWFDGRVPFTSQQLQITIDFIWIYPLTKEQLQMEYNIDAFGDHRLTLIHGVTKTPIRMASRSPN